MVKFLFKGNKVKDCAWKFILQVYSKRYLAMGDSYQRIGRNYRYGLDMESLGELDKFLSRAAIATVRLLK